MNYPEALYVGKSSVQSFTEESWEDIENDPRGLLLMFEPPDKKARYIMGLDASEGITGWTRATRTKGDHKTDNGAIVIFKVDGMWEPIYKVVNGKKVQEFEADGKHPKRLYKDVQVAEWAGPVDAVEIARIANVLGTVYAGNEEDQCTLIWEAWPGVGLLTTQELLRLNYHTLWYWEYIDSAAEETDRPGWRSTPTSQRILWYRARRHIMNRQLVIRSKALLEEYSNAEIDMTKMRARAAYGYHDDRMQAANMALWAAHRWSYDTDSSSVAVLETPPPMDYQRYAPGLDDYLSYDDWKQSAVAELEE